MIWKGMVDEGLLVVRAIHDRYHPRRRNPYNEVEAGDHYARAMAPYNCFLAIGGFDYDGPAGKIGFAPKITPEAFRTAFTASSGWGRYEQSSSEEAATYLISVLHGELMVREWRVQLPLDTPVKSIAVTANGKTLDVSPQQEGQNLVLRLPHEMVLVEGQQLEARLGW